MHPEKNSNVIRCKKSAICSVGPELRVLLHFIFGLAYPAWLCWRKSGWGVDLANGRERLFNPRCVATANTGQADELLRHRPAQREQGLDDPVAWATEQRNSISSRGSR